MISPPGSPPDDWVPDLERRPAVDYELLKVLANLGPGQEHTLVAARADLPGVSVTVSDDPRGYKAVPIPQTSRPPDRHPKK